MSTAYRPSDAGRSLRPGLPDHAWIVLCTIIELHRKDMAPGIAEEDFRRWVFELQDAGLVRIVKSGDGYSLDVTGDGLAALGQTFMANDNGRSLK